MNRLTIPILLGIAFSLAAPPARPDPPAGSRRLEEKLAAIRAKHGVPALAAAMMRGDALVASAAVGVRAEGSEEPIRLGDAFHLGSCTKAMTATLAALLVERGRIAWDTTIAQALPEIADTIQPEYRSVTLAQLLGNRSGLPDNDHFEPGVWEAIWKLDGPMPSRRRQAAEVTLRQRPLAKPGEKELYTNLGFTVAGAMLEAATKRSWEDLLREELFVPLGMKSAGFGAPGTAGADPPDAAWGHVLRPDGTLDPRPPGPGSDNPEVIGPAGTVHASIEDFARFARLHVAGARGASGLPLPASAFERLHRPPDGGAYAMGWIVTERPWGKGRVFTHAGSNTMWFAIVWLAPERDAAFVAACNRPGDAGLAACDAAIGTLIQEFLKD